jgi:primosomal protein N' (replication factor Y)
VQVGSIVRVPLSGRRTRGFVVQLGGDREGALKDIAALSSEVPVFDTALLKTIIWAAGHYVAPVSVLLDRTAPPNLPSLPGTSRHGPQPGRSGGGHHPLLGITREIAAGRRRPTSALVGRWQGLDWLDAVLPVLDAGSSVLVVTATETEASTVGSEARNRGIETVVVAGEVARELTGAWVEAQHGGRLVVGTPRSAMWQVAGLALVIVLEEGRRAMKDRQTPTLHVREVLTTRSRIEGFSLVFIGPTPTVEVLASGPEIVRVGTRAWSLVEVVDRREDPPGSGLLAERTVAAIRATIADDRPCFVFTHRRASDSSMRCVDCRRVRICPGCGSRLGRQPACPRCGRATEACAGCGGTGFEEMGSEPERLAVEINRKLGRDVAGVHPTGRPVAVGTERDLTSTRAVPLAVAVDVDGLMLGHNYRTTEEALRILARLANLVETGHGRRMIAQTSLPDSPLLTALRRGDPIPYLEGLLVERARLGLPPATDMLAVEIRDVEGPGRVDQDLRGLQPAAVLGPATVASGWRWLLQGRLGPLKPKLRPLVQAWRESGATVRIDADPIDL